ncbi:NUDIX domain-containing protein [uncultured Methanobrevibacter sp.]|uniref:NUDIX domain-containing protein n=1 Tax=uncultured Methanobrevibacter sp. TaxID=253161 RepID=UPI0025EA492B|nr:NUDIX domain-containing protein [uncultured Methanobrevibacter sp.]
MDHLWGLTVRGICTFNEKILLLKISSNSGHDAGLWEIPGGKVKKDEFFDEALKREYLEETGLEINIESLYNVVENRYIACKSSQKINSIQLIMSVSVSSNDVKISSEHSDYGWFSKKEIDDMINDELLTIPAINAFKKHLL